MNKNRILIQSLKNKIGQTVRFYGWVSAIRDQKNVQFLVIRDHSGLVQVVNDKNLHPDIATLISSLTLESAVEVSGRVLENDKVKLSGIEIAIEHLVLLNPATTPLPIDDTSGLDLRMDWRFLDLRKPKNYLIFQLQTCIEKEMRAYWYAHDFIEIHSPKLMGSPSESGAELFELNYFDKTAYLAQSPQFYKQMAMSAGFDRVFEIGPVFRANPSFTSRHDTEFTSVDVEISWIQSHEDVMACEEQWLHYVLKQVHEKLGAKIEAEFELPIRIPSLPFPRVTMKQAKEILASLNHPLPEQDDLDPEGERLLSAFIRKEYDHDFVFVTDYPSEVRPFYHMRYENQPHITKSFDLLWNGLEVTSGAQREHRYDVLVKQAQEKGLGLEHMKDYLNSFKYGTPPHGGFGFGLSRMIMILLGLKNVREATYLYRGPNRLFP